MAACRPIFRRSRIAGLALALAGVLAAVSSASAAGAGYPEDEIEAAFIYRFADFVAWPRHALGHSTFTIAVLNDEPVASDLERMRPAGKLTGRRFRIRRITRMDQLGDAQILFIGAGDASMLKRRLARLAGRHVLVVTSQPGGLRDGSTINFLLIHRHVRFEISLVAAQRAGLNISADLLSVATHIEGRPTGFEAPCDTSPPLFDPGIACSSRLAGL
jgi:hypothetical protein